MEFETEEIKCCPGCGRGAHDNATIWWQSDTHEDWHSCRCAHCFCEFKVLTTKGRERRAESEAYHQRRLAEHGWRAEMTDDEVLALAKVMRPLNRRPGFVKDYWSMRDKGWLPATIWRRMLEGGAYIEPAMPLVG